MPTKPPTVEELLERTEILQRGGPRCWAARLEGNAKLFIEGCQKKIENDEPFHPATALRIAQETFGINIKITAFTKHITKKCGCYDIWDK